MIGNPFRTTSEKLGKRLADLETEAVSLEKRATEARTAAADAQARLVEDLAEGLPVDDWRKKREASEKRAADAERDLAAAREAAVLVSDRLEKTRAGELLEDLRRRYAEAEKSAPGVLEDFLAAGRAFSDALGRLEGLRSRVDSLHGQIRACGDREVQIAGIRNAEDALSDALGHADGRVTLRIGIPTWPHRTNP